MGEGPPKTATVCEYNNIEINEKKIRRHRLRAYCFLGLDDIVGNGRDDVIDHIDNNPLNNSVANLRITTQQGNQHNRPTTKGYTWCKKDKKWKATIKLSNKKIY